MSEAGAGISALAKTAGVALMEGDGMPVVILGQDINQTARRLGEIVQRLDLYEMNGELVWFDERGEMRPMTAQIFRGWINEWVLLAVKYDKESGEPIQATMRRDDAGTILVLPNFRRGVRTLRAVNRVRLPVVRPDGKLEKLPWGYDTQTQAYTVPGGADYDSEMDVEAAKGKISRVFSSFPISDERSLSVQVAAMLALFVKHLPGGNGLRPGLLWLANKAGSGKSVLAKAALYPVLGSAAASKMKKGEELDKELEGFTRASVPYIFFDNVYESLASASLDQLLTSEETTARAMGGHGIFTAKNTALLLVTGNRLELNEDAARRFLVVDLFEKGELETRQVPQEALLNDRVMRTKQWRVGILEALWALVAHWHEQGMQKGGMSLPSFEDYAALLGGIVTSAGYGDPFRKAEIPDSLSPEKADFQELMVLVLQEMGDAKEKDFTLEDLARIARSGQLFQKQVGTQEEGRKLTIKEDGLGKDERGYAEDRGYLTPGHRSSWGKAIRKQVGTEPVVAGKRLEFGQRLQSRKATFTLRVLN